VRLVLLLAVLLLAAVLLAAAAMESGFQSGQLGPSQQAPRLTTRNLNPRKWTRLWRLPRMGRFPKMRQRQRHQMELMETQMRPPKQLRHLQPVVSAFW
jgi:hypothetical protein